MCFIVGCLNGNNGKKLPDGVRRHYFPSTPWLRQKWIDQSNRAISELKRADYICSVHFEIDDFIPDKENLDSRGKPKKIKRLKASAYPKLKLKPEEKKTQRQLKAREPLLLEQGKRRARRLRQ